MEFRILIALEDEYRAYREVLAAGFRALRPNFRIETAVPPEVEEEASRFDPQVVICSSPRPAEAHGPTAWIELSTEPSRPTVVHSGGRRTEHSNPTFEELVEIVDEARRRSKAEKRDETNESATGGAAPAG